MSKVTQVWWGPKSFQHIELLSDAQNGEKKVMRARLFIILVEWHLTGCLLHVQTIWLGLETALLLFAYQPKLKQKLVEFSWYGRWQILLLKVQNEVKREGSNCLLEAKTIIITPWNKMKGVGGWGRYWNHLVCVHLPRYFIPDDISWTADFCFQIWYIHVSSWAGVSGKWFGLLFSRSRSWWKFKAWWLFCLFLILWHARLLVTKLDMLMLASVTGWSAL